MELYLFVTFAVIRIRLYPVKRKDNIEARRLFPHLAAFAGNALSYVRET